MTKVLHLKIVIENKLCAIELHLNVEVYRYLLVCNGTIFTIIT